MTLDAVSLSVFVSVLSGIAEEMGAVLVQAASSPNIKERRDCSCAVLDADGRMLAQAEHIPVHLGAMPDAVAAVIAREPRPGDVFVLNDPFTGGTHLPDITLVSPVALGSKVHGYVASRAHHSDVGGMQPGSMPSASRSIYQEGLVLPPVRLVDAGRPVDDLLAVLLANVRTPELRRADLRAQQAANDLGVRRLQALVERDGPARFAVAAAEVLAYGERRARAVVAALPDGTYVAEGEIEGDGVDDVDVPIRAAVTVAGERLVVDLAGTAPAVRGNVNCPLAVTRSACLFALRVLLPADVPTNAGTAAVLDLRVPPGSLVDARRPSAVVAGNVETSQRIADVVLDALRQAVDLPAAGQGTMNNVILGGEDWTYYETIGGGQGASARGPGAAGVHVGMTNTLNTPVEALELEYPLRVERYELRDGSGGAGAHPGGEGLERALRVLQPATLSVLADRRRHAPAGTRGGGPGACGQTLLDGEELPPKATREVEAGQLLVVRTPGGGGYGPSSAVKRSR